MIDLHSLKVPKVNEAINELKGSKLTYNILGGRFNFTAGESCATACYTALIAGGLDALLRADRQILGRHSILTPLKLTQFVETAKVNEYEIFPDRDKITEQFEQNKLNLLNSIKVEIELIKKLEIETNLKKKYGSNAQYRPKQ